MKTIDVLKKEKGQLEQNIRDLIYDFMQQNKDIDLSLSVDIRIEKFNIREIGFSEIEVNAKLKI